jgi:hypothetical protein
MVHSRYAFLDVNNKRIERIYSEIEAGNIGDVLILVDDLWSSAIDREHQWSDKYESEETPS